MSVDWRGVAARVFKEESARILAGLIRLSGSFDWAEEAMQDAFTRALTEWPEKGVPTNPGAWITTVARRRIVDRARREATRTEYEPSVAAQLMSLASGDDTAEQEPMPEYPDDRLRLMFTCCHPALNMEARIALTLRTLGGLQTPEIAHAFLVSEATMAQRLVRAKRKIQEARIPYETPRLDRLAERLDAVRAVLYLIFNEGYSATEGQGLVRHDLCREAIRLARMLCDLVPGEPENFGLLALMLLNDARRNARVDDDGSLLTLEEQDRSRWDWSQVDDGMVFLARALGQPTRGPYILQATIAGIHARARTPEDTDWVGIEGLYRQLMAMSNSPVVALNYAVAVAMSRGLEEGLALIEELAAGGALAGYRFFYIARAEVLRRLRRWAEALTNYERALGMTANEVERRLLTARIAAVRSQALVDSAIPERRSSEGASGPSVPAHRRHL
jgi:RNA polymerase sigma-70 factor (ECF subfamily)